MSDIFRQCAATVRLVVFDVDGVLTDGRVYLGDNGDEFRAFDIKDGHGIRLLLHYGVQVAALSGRESGAAEQRLRGLGVEHILQGHKEKGPAFERLLEDCGAAAEHVAYLGDDLPDLGPMRRAGLACAVADAHPRVIECADWVARAKGGHGAARELCDALLKARGTWEEALKHCLT